jgi:anti-anti-sigma factor
MRGIIPFMKKNKRVCSNDNISITERDGRFEIKVIGDFDSATTPSIHECCKKIAKEPVVKSITINFEKVKRMDTSAVACMIDFLKEKITRNIKIYATNLQESEKRIIKLLNVEKIITVK